MSLVWGSLMFFLLGFFEYIALGRFVVLRRAYEPAVILKMTNSRQVLLLLRLAFINSQPHIPEVAEGYSGSLPIGLEER